MSENFIHIVLKNFFKISFSLTLLGFFFYIMSPFLISIVLGGILAMSLSRFVDFFVKKGLSRRLSLVTLSLLLGVVGFLPIAGFFIRGFRMISIILKESGFNDLLQKFLSPLHVLISHMSKVYSLDDEFIRLNLDRVLLYGKDYLSQSLSSFLSDLPLIFMMGFITVLSVYFFLHQSEKIRALFDRYFYFPIERGDKFIHVLSVSCREVFFANILTGLLQATIVSIGAFIFNVGDFFLIFFITFVVSFIPVIGAAPIAAILSMLCFMDSEMGAGVGMLVIAAVSGISDNLIRPYLGSIGEVHVPPFIGFLAVIGGVIMFGIPGLFIGPLIASLIFGALPIIIDEYFPHNH